MSKRGTGSVALTAAFSFVLALLAGLPARRAGAWEFTYGPPADADFASRRVIPVRSCPGGGYIVVGTQMFTPGTGDDVKVVRADPRAPRCGRRPTTSNRSACPTWGWRSRRFLSVRVPLGFLVRRRPGAGPDLSSTASAGSNGARFMCPPPGSA